MAGKTGTYFQDIISYVNGTAQDNQDSPVIEAQVIEQQVEEPFEVPPEEIDELLEEIRKPKRVRRKSAAKVESSV